jgi:cation transport regulator ChaC
MAEETTGDEGGEQGGSDQFDPKSLPKEAQEHIRREVQAQSDAKAAAATAAEVAKIRAEQAQSARTAVETARQNELRQLANSGEYEALGKRVSAEFDQREAQIGAIERASTFIETQMKEAFIPTLGAEKVEEVHRETVGKGGAHAEFALGLAKAADSETRAKEIQAEVQAQLTAAGVQTRDATAGADVGTKGGQGQPPTTAELDECQRKVIAKTLFTEEYERPVSNLVQQFSLGQGEKTLSVPKVGQMSAAKLIDGVDMVDSQDIGMVVNDFSPVEAGLKVIVTDKLVRQLNESVFAMVGEQMGEAMGRIVEEDEIALFASLNGGTTLGADGKYLTLNNLAACIAKAKANKYGNQLVIVHHPNAVFEVAKDFFGATPQRLDAPSFVDSIVRDFYSFSLNGVPVFNSGLIPKESGVDSGYGAIFDRRALGYLQSQGLTSGMEHDNSLRASELVTVKDYLAFEVDDARGAPMQYEIGDLTTST